MNSSSVIVTFEIFCWQKFGVERYAHTQFLSYQILDPFDIFCRWYKLSFGLLQGQVKSHHFYDRIEPKRQYFYFLYIFLGIIGWKQHWETLLYTDLDSLLPFKWNWIRLTPD